MGPGRNDFSSVGPEQALDSDAGQTSATHSVLANEAGCAHRLYFWTLKCECCVIFICHEIVFLTFFLTHLTI